MTQPSKGSKVLILGAGSGIAQPLVYRLAEKGCDMVLAGRNIDELEVMASDIRIRHEVQVRVEAFDAIDFEDQEDFLGRCFDCLDKPLDGAIVCYGAMHEQEDAAVDFDKARQMIEVNFTSVALLLGRLANYMEERQQGFLAAISSVAGDRGRQSNYIYGSTKAGVSAFLQGLRNRLHHSGVRVLTIKPGFVDTAMTRGKLDPKSPLVAQPDRVARDIVRGLGRKNVIYTPWFWRGIMFIIRSIPEWLFKRLKM